MNPSFIGVTRSFLQCQARQYRFVRQVKSSGLPPDGSSFLPVERLGARRRGNLQFTSQALLCHPQEDIKGAEKPQNVKRKTRSSAAKNSLRRVAVEAQRSRDGKESVKPSAVPYQTTPKTVTAICAAEEYDIAQVAHILEGLGHTIDPFRTELQEQVVHVSLPVPSNAASRDEATWSSGDLFIFPSGTVVAWAIPENLLFGMVSRTLLSAAKHPLDKHEEEDLEYIEDSNREHSSIKGDRVVLGTKPQSSNVADEAEANAPLISDHDPSQAQSRSLDTVLAKIAFSSGLARSTKLAVLESLLGNYFESTKSIPAELSRGGRMPFSRSFISQKTGQLLSIRAQLNLYSELTDSLPDLFWDSRHELGLEGYYDQVSKALDTNIRIKVLNEKMDYAQEIASVLRQHLSEVHGVRLEWIIIILIAVEVVFAIRNEIKDYLGRKSKD